MSGCKRGRPIEQRRLGRRWDVRLDGEAAWANCEVDLCPESGDLVQLRSRRWLVERVEQPSKPGDSPVVRLACAEQLFYVAGPVPFHAGRVHRETVQHHWDRQDQTEPSESAQASSEAREPGGTTPGRRTAQEAQHLFPSGPGAGDEHERDEWTEEQAEQEERRQIEVLTEIAESEGVLDQHGGATSTTWPDVRLGAERC